MKRIIAALAFSGFLAFGAGIGCSSGTGNPASPGTADEEEKHTRMPDVPDDGPEVSSEGKQWSGWRWKGKRNDCFFVHKNQCFDSKRAACKAAGCNTSDCRTSGGGPAKVTCR